MKLSNADRNRILARSLFVDANKSYADIALALEVSDKTIANYQSKDKSEGFDWLTLRASKHIKETQETKENMYSMFITYMYQTLKEIRENEKMGRKKYFAGAGNALYFWRKHSIITANKLGSVAARGGRRGKGGVLLCFGAPENLTDRSSCANTTTGAFSGCVR